MRFNIVSFASGVCLLQQQPQLPALAWALLLAPILVLWWRLSLRAADGRGAKLAAMLLANAMFAAAGYFYAAAWAQWRLADRLAPRWEGPDLSVTGVVAGLPQPFERGVRFDFEVEQVEPAEARLPRRIALSWYEGSTREEFQDVAFIRAGERWRFSVRLRRPHGSANPYGFDYESLLMQRAIGATGYVRPGGTARLDDLMPRPAYLIQRAREILRERHWDTLPGYPYAGILIALAIGDQNAIDAKQWQLFARTGVSHLMSISGLHVTMVASLFALLVHWLWRRSSALMLALPARKAAALAGFLAALGYCLIAGFGVPAQRTLYMVGVVALALWAGRVSSVSRVLCAALLLVLLLDPWAVLAPGFWLSFGAVAVILYVATGRLRARQEPASARGFALGNSLVQWGRVQWAITLALAPLLLVWFQQMSLVSPLANAVAIPLVSLVVTPLALAGSVLPFDFLLKLAHAVMAAQMWLLEWWAASPAAVWQQHAPAAWTVALALAGTAWLLLPRGVPARWLGLLLVLPLFTVVPPAPPPGALWLTVLDVGQGLAIFVQTERHALLYDAGPAYSPEADSGSRVILPFLRASGIARLDAMVVTHDDNDHAGGAASVLSGLPVAAFYSSLPETHAAWLAAPGYRLPCAAGQGWDWDAVRFELLHPTPGSYAIDRLKSNDRSCVLRIATARGAVLLTGDIEARSEEELLARAPGKLRADVLVVPHHSSRTSSTQEFIAAVQPRWAVLPVGYRNRFGHPQEAVVERYRAGGAQMLRTDSAGAVLVRIDGEGIVVQGYRGLRKRYWYAE
ncbi:MAG: DNA internalization-related competence protein ComEC/Rec2 [Betaproteobacteria bacterium RIFCSPLOWO2_12_FULL_64_23]|nr:MAG: DNA internalization-related competence protein ComEC/Rec2 [Betaproteobacteria bacterium RIFCSPLOWO2_12_FULL_64_23]